MNEPEELQGLTFTEFNKLMGRLCLYSSEWANYIKMRKNKKTTNVNPNIYDNTWHEGFIGEIKSHDISNSECCIVGETYNNTMLYKYSTIHADLRCDDCDTHSVLLYTKGNVEHDRNTSIVNLKQLNLYLTHVEKKHKNIKAELLCRNI